MSEYPCKRWRLMPSFRPAEVEIVSEYKPWGGDQATHFVSKSGAYHSMEKIYATREDAIAGGRARLKEQEAEIAKKLASIEKKRSELDKAERN